MLAFSFVIFVITILSHLWQGHQIFHMSQYWPSKPIPSHHTWGALTYSSPHFTPSSPPFTEVPFKHKLITMFIIANNVLFCLTHQSAVFGWCEVSTTGSSPSVPYRPPAYRNFMWGGGHCPLKSLIKLYNYGSQHLPLVPPPQRLCNVLS